MALRARFLIQDHFRPRVRKFIQNLMSSAPRAGIDVRSATQYRYFEGTLIVWGAGRPETADIVAQHVESGYPAVCWDVGYWHRLFRFAVNGHHPTSINWPYPGPARFDGQQIKLRNEYDPNGHIVLVGLGPKSRHMDSEWEAVTLERIREAYPNQRVVYRPKPNRPFVPLDCETDRGSPIEDVIRGARLVVCRHSNVGIDACFAGVPVVAEMGAPTLLYGSDLANPINPAERERREFLRRLAWLNWTDGEARSPDLWIYLKRYLSSIPSGTG